MAQRKWVACVLSLLIGAVAGGAQEIRYHGESLDENHRVLIEEQNGVCRIGVFERSRFAGDRLIQLAPVGPGISPRANPEPEFLLEVRAEVLKPSAPNYLQNPGERYRISIETLKLEPYYANEVEVAAEHARDQLFYEFEVLRVRATGIEEKALAAAAPLVAEIFKEAQRLPAEIYTSVLRSRSGRFRITEETRQRRRIEPSQVFAPKPDFARPELGATERMRQRQALPEGAEKPGEIAAPKPEARFAKPVNATLRPPTGDD
ncbi:MAG: hypothetical protein AMXMBFR4_13510 [Candidatus Hydrogenedentota bacterium]